MLLHPLGFSEGKRLSRFSFNNTIGNPLDTTIALHYLIFDGVLERHPNLKIIAVHGGGYLAAYSGRIDHSWGARSDAHGNLPHPPTTYLKKIYFDSVVFTPHQLAELVRLYGADRIIMGTDYPVRHGGLRSDRACRGRGGLRRVHHRRHRRRECEAIAGAVALSTLSEQSKCCRAPRSPPPLAGEGAGRGHATKALRIPALSPPLSRKGRGSTAACAARFALHRAARMYEITPPSRPPWPRSRASA